MVPSVSMVIMPSGEVDIIANDARVATLGQNACLGEMALVGNQSRSATARVTQNARLYRLWSEDFNQLLETEPEVSLALLRTLTARLRQVSTTSAATQEV